MRDDERRARRRLRAEQRGELALALRVDAARRLVEHEQVGLDGEHGGDREALALAAREVARVPVGERGQVELLERAPRARLAGGERDLGEHRLGDEVAAGILRQVRGAAEADDAARRPARAAPPRASRASSCRRRSGRRARRPRRAAATSDSSTSTGGPPGYANETRSSRTTSSPPRAMPRRGARRLGPRRRQLVGDAPVAQEDDAVGERERQLGPLLGDDDRAAVRARVLEERLGGVAVELRRRLVEQQQLRLERERRREADALQLAARELRDGTLREVLGTDRGKRRERARHDLRRRRAEVLEPERHLGEHARQHDLVLGLLEQRRDRAGELGRARRARVAAADDDAPGETAAVEVRHEPGERAQQRRLARARGAEQRDELARLDLERHVVERRPRARPDT